MKKISLWGFALLAVVALAAIQGCTKAPVDVVGKWAEVDGPDRIEFTPAGTFSGTFVYDSDAFEKTFGGKYSVDGDKVTLTAQDDKRDSMVWKVSLENSVLSVVYKDGGAPKLDGTKAKFRHSQ
jgi:hypothetical protein